MNSAAVVNKNREMLGQLLDLVLLATIGILVPQAKVGVATMLAILFGALGLVQTRHNMTS